MNFRQVLIITGMLAGLIYCAGCSGSSSATPVNPIINFSPMAMILCPPNVLETEPFSCAIGVFDIEEAAQDLTCSLNSGTTCSNAVINGCTQIDVPALGEAAGPGSCELVVDVFDNAGGAGQGNFIISINEDNQAPGVTVDCPSSLMETAGTVCVLSAADPDVPAQTLACSLDATTTCAGVSLTDCTQIAIPAQGEAAGPGSCAVVVNVQDNMGASGQGSDTINVLEDNQNPVVIVNCPTDALETAGAVCSLTAADADVPAQTLSCSLNASTTCTGIAITGCSQVDVSPQGETAGPGVCDVVVDILDSFAGSGQGNDSMIILEDNSAPTWVVFPTDITISTNSVYNQINGQAIDSDLPVQTLTCSSLSNTCSFAVNISGSGAGSVNCDMNFTAGPASESCNVDIEVSDGADSLIAAINITTGTPVTVWYVNDDATGAGTGTSWANAFTVIQSAVDSASFGEQVWVAEGTYYRPVGGTSLS